MTNDLDTMAARLVDDVDDVRCCVILSAGGAVLSATPSQGAIAGSEIWARFRDLGVPRRGFVMVGEEIWAVVNQGERAGVLVAADSAAPGLLLERLEMLVVAARQVPVPAPAETAPGAEEGGSTVLSEVTPGEVAEAAEAVLEAEAQAAEAEDGAPPVPESLKAMLPPPDPDVDPMLLVREFAWLQEDRRPGE